ncbi:MAG: PilC/PilY family type IV pilus protein, partial [Gammaproteobacteria bacterium]|nr:PilC/PilY family type IV pilus protein [Gammaproteobacteria bacterium]
SAGNDCPALPAPAGTCQQNFTLLFSDGYWNGDSGILSNDDEDGAGPFDGGRYEDNFSQTLADVAIHYYETDLFPLIENQVPVSQRDISGAPAATFSAADDTMHQHMKTFAIAFGVVGTVDPVVVPGDPTTAFSWPDPFSGPLEKIDDMLHASLNGRGGFLDAGNPQQLQAAFQAAFLEFTQAASSTSNAAFNSTSLREGTLLYRGSYDLRDNTGELTATVVNADGSIAASPTWRASEQLDPPNMFPNDRVLITSDSSTGDGIAFRYASLAPEQQLNLSLNKVNYLRGDRINESPVGTLRERPATNGLLGDIVDSSPVFIGEPRAINRDQSPYPTSELYSTFVAASRDRTPIVYVGANDGMLHGFDAATGLEVFGYVPNKFLDGTQRYRSPLEDLASPYYIHKYYVNLTPRFNDVFMQNSRSLAGGKHWNTVLLGGLGGGGKGFFALNVTDPGTQFSSEVSAASSVLWEFTDKDDTYPVDSAGTPLGGAVGAITDPFGEPVKDLGLALSLPTITMSNVSDGGASSENEWIAIFGNGTNSTSGIAKLFVLFMDRGLDGWSDAGDFVKLDTGFGVPIAPAQQAGFPNALGTATAVDRDLNGTVDLVYAGDRLGHLFRFDLSDPDPANWTTTLLFTASYDDGVTERLQPILAKPEVGRHPTEDGFLIIFGTGSHITKDDSSNGEIQSIYGIWDRGEASPATAFANSKALRLVQQTITNVVDDSTGTAVTRRLVSSNPVNYQPESDVPGTYGWHIDLDIVRAETTLSGGSNDDASGNAPPDVQFPGEKAVRRMIVRNGTVITTTLLPNTNETSCFGTRPGAVLLFSARDGADPSGAVIDFNTDGVIDDDDLVDYGGRAYAAGILFNQDDLDGSLVDLTTLGGERGQDIIFISGGSETLSLLLEDVRDNRTGRLSWRELDDAN